MNKLGKFLFGGDPVADISKLLEQRASMSGATREDWINIGLVPPSDTIVTRDTALTFSAIWSCIQVLSETLASIPLNTYQQVKGGKEVDKNHFTYQLLHNEPNQVMTSFTWRQTMMLWLLTEGNAYSEIIRDASAKPLSLNILPSDCVEPGITSSGKPFYTFTDPSTGSVRKIKSENMLHIVGLSFNGLVGLSPISAHREAIGMALNTQSFGNTFYKNNAAIGTVLEHPGMLKPDTATRIQNSFNAKFAGKDNAGKTVVLEEGMKLSKMTITQADAQYVETMRFTVEEACRIFRVPPHMVADLSRSTNNNIEEQGISFVRDTMMPYVRRWEDEINRKLFRENEKGSVFAEFNVNGLMRGNATARASYYGIMRQNKIMNANEIRALENMNAYDGGDIYENPNISVTETTTHENTETQ